MSFRFWQYVELSDDAACWLWRASYHPDGYGQFVHKSKPVGAHRMAFTLVYGPPGPGVRVGHRCSNRACANPAHLVLAEAKFRRKAMPQPPSRQLELADRDIERFRSKFDSSALDECWHWTASKLIGGYGSFWLAGMNVPAHRVAYTLAHGPIPDGLCVCHHCDNPPCVNPSHLFLGAQDENQADKVAKQRQSRGESHGMSRLTAADAIELRRLAAVGVKRTILATRFNVSRAVVHAIVGNRIWRPSTPVHPTNPECLERQQERS